MNFNEYARTYISSVSKDHNDVSYDDRKLIEERLMPNSWKVVMNPFKWTEKQISEDDNLLKICKEANQAQEQKDKEDMDKARSDFDERLEGWQKKDSKH